LGNLNEKIKWIKIQFCMMFEPAEYGRRIRLEKQFSKKFKIM